MLSGPKPHKSPVNRDNNLLLRKNLRVLRALVVKKQPLGLANVCGDQHD